MTPEIKQQLQALLSLPPEQRAAELDRLAIEADVCPHEARKAELRELLLVVSRCEMMPAQPQEKATIEPPTLAQTWAVFVWIVSIVAPFGLAAGVLFLVGAAVIGIGDALTATLYENRAIVGVVCACVFGLVLVTALPKIRASGQRGGTRETFEEEVYYRHTKWEKQN